MKTSVNNRGSSTAVTWMIAVIAVIVVIIGLTGWYVWRTSDNANRTLNETSRSSNRQAAAKPKQSPPATTSYTFPLEKMVIAYSSSWSVTAKSQAPNQCGQNDQLTLKDNNLALNFAFGSVCGKGSAPCFQEPGSGCTAESKNLATVQLEDAHQAYILVYRTTNDNGQSWSYTIGLTTASDCTADFCSYTAVNLGHGGGSTISAAYSPPPGQQVTSLDQFANLPEVQAAITVLKTAHY